MNTQARVMGKVRSVTQEGLSSPFRHVLLIGNSKETHDIATNINKTSEKFKVVGCLTLCPRAAAEPAPASVPMLGAFSEVKTVLESRRDDVDVVMITDPEVRHHQILEMISLARKFGVELWVVPRLSSALYGHLRFFNFHGHPVIKIYDTKTRPSKLILKTVMDYSLAVIGLALAAPVMILIACLIKLTSKGPVFFRQERVGRNGRTFKVIKFRSMRADAEQKSGPVLSDINDARVTFLGNILRKTHLDELPQLLNIVNGTMSLVGPRPERPFFVNNFVRLIPFYSDRFVVKPGITGMAQVYGSYHSKAEEKLIFDLNYIHNLGFFLDVKLCVLTVVEAAKAFLKR